MKLVWTEEPLLAVEGLSLEYATVVVANIVIILVEHVAGPDSVYALLTFFFWQSLMQILIEDEDFIVFGHLLEAFAI